MVVPVCQRVGAVRARLQWVRQELLDAQLFRLCSKVCSFISFLI